jgi:tetratricopeptide (TPR) repeat protein
MGLMLALVTLLVYLPATRDSFLNYDDGDYVTENRVVQNGISWAGIQWAFTGWHASNWHPITWLSHMVDCDLFRLNPSGHHLVNILFHAANTALFFTLLFRLTNAVWPAAFIAALFALHPLHVESVAWISERKDVLSTFFALLALGQYAGYCLERSRRDFWLTWLFLALGLMSKPMLVTLPLVMLLLDYWPLQRLKTASLRHLLFEKWPFFMLSAASCVVTFVAQRQEAVASLQKTSLALRFENIPTAYVGYLLKMIWPVNLAVFYPLPKQVPWEHWALAVAILASISMAAWQMRQQRPYFLMGWLWFLVTLVPVIGLVQVGDQAMADRYTYFSLAGIFITITFAARELTVAKPVMRSAIASVAILILSACTALTENQLGYWRDSESLFRHALAVTEDNATAHLNLGAALEADDKPDSALAEYKRVLQLDPLRYEAWNDIAKLLYENRPEEALPYCQRAVQLNPKHAAGHNSLGLILVKLNRLEEAMGEFSLAAQLDANYASPRFQMGRILLKQGHGAQAMKQFHAALPLDPNNLSVLIYIARVLASDEDPQIRNGGEALALAERTNQLTVAPQMVGQDTLAMAYAETGHYDEALQAEQQAIALAPTNSSAEDVASLQKRLQLYKLHQPWRESFTNN